MSDYATIGEIQLKAQMFQPAVLDAFRRGDLTYHDIYKLGPPINEVYRNTYRYIQTPDYPSPQSLQLVSSAMLSPIPLQSITSMAYADRAGVMDQLLRTGGSPDSSITARPFPVQVGQPKPQ
jgi:hypothetical protein